MGNSKYIQYYVKFLINLRKWENPSTFNNKEIFKYSNNNEKFHVDLTDNSKCTYDYEQFQEHLTVSKILNTLTNMEISK